MREVRLDLGNKSRLDLEAVAIEAGQQRRRWEQIWAMREVRSDMGNELWPDLEAATGAQLRWKGEVEVADLGRIAMEDGGAR